MEPHDWSDEELEKEGSHPLVFSQLGGHTSSIKIDHTGVRHESAAFLLNLGEKSMPLFPFLRYSGLWGSRGVMSATSGYWGPAYNETDMNDGPEQFHPAWCAGMLKELRERSVAGISECYSKKGPSKTKD